MKEVRSYVTRSVFSTLALSVYILADTLFIANGVGNLGLTALNIALPLFNLLNGLGLLLGMGGATLFSLQAGKNNYFSQLITTALLLGGGFTLLGLFFVTPIATVLGASPATLELTVMYLRFILIMAPFFILNNLVLAFVRNDSNPQLAMMAMLASSLFNIVFDYIFVFPMGMGMAGAALATVLSPVLSLAILSLHRKKPQRKLTLVPAFPRLETISRSVQLGMSSFLTEMSTGVSILIFNQVLLSLRGDVAVAAYGVLANIVLVGLAMFTGVAQGVQPLISRATGKGDQKAVQSYLKFGLQVSLGLAVILYTLLLIFKYPITGFFNSDNDPLLTSLAVAGIPIYFLAFFASSSNILLSIFFSAVGKARQAFTIALLRGYLLIIPILLIASRFAGITGVWSSLPITEFLTMAVAYGLLFAYRKETAAKKKNVGPNSTLVE